MKELKELKDGVYKHDGDGRYYQVLFVAELMDDIKKDGDLYVYANHSAGGTYESQSYARLHVFANKKIDDVKTGENYLYLFSARAHADYAKEIAVAVYVPLYTDKPGRRVSVRDANDFFDGDVIREAHLRTERMKFWYYGIKIDQSPAIPPTTDDC